MYESEDFRNHNDNLLINGSKKKKSSGGFQTMGSSKFLTLKLLIHKLF